MSRRILLTLVFVSAFALVLSACTTDPTSQAARPRAGGAVTEGNGEEDGLDAEIAEHNEEVTERLEALEEARQDGTVGKTGRLAAAPATGWAGERPVSATGDDWEPAVATDPAAPYVYLLHNRYGGTPACASNCPDPAMILHVSTDGGATWRADQYMCVCKKVKGQFDPIIEVVPTTGAVYAVWMNDYNIVFSKSTNHGSTWSTPVPVYGNVSFGDKPNLGMSPDGRNVYVLFNGPTGGDVYAAVSHDAGATWTQVRVTNDNRYHYDYGVTVLPTGRAVSSEFSITYTGPGAAAEGPVKVHVYSSDDAGVTWTDKVVDTLELGSPCTSTGCYPEFYDSGPVIAQDTNGDLVLVYSGAATPSGPRTMYARSSRDGGRTWSARTVISSAGANAAFAAAVGTGNDGARVWFGEQRNGRWNVWYRTTADLGTTWSSAVKISDATSGTAYKDANGFVEMYGDYGEIAITSAGKTFAVWAEGISYTGPGGVWYNRQQ